MLDSIVCSECPAKFTPRNRTVRRCPACATRRKRNGQPEAARKRRRRDGGRPERNAKLRGVRWWGIDGEGERLADGSHGYTYLCAVAEDGEVTDLYDGGAKLTTPAMLKFLWSVGKPGDMWTFYSSGYDWTHILRDLDTPTLRKIYSPGPEDVFTPVETPVCGINFMKNSVTLTREDGIERFISDISRVAGTGPFVDFIDSWQTGTEVERAEIRRMKLQRGHLEKLDPAEVHRYCQMECRHTAEGAGRLWRALIDLNIVPARSRMYSAGSLAKALFRSWDVHKFNGPDRYAGADKHLAAILRRGYFGARIDLAEPGPWDRLERYDLSSAYPAVMETLPCLAHGHWAYDHHWSPNAPPQAVDLARPEIVHVQWGRTHMGEPVPHWAPLPWRSQQGTIYYPMHGEGWYWRSEAESAKRIPGFWFRELESWTWVQECEHLPFARVRDIYDQRQAFKREGDRARELALKVTLNSGYGTTADTVSDEDPPFASIIWAAMITAGCRARINEVLARHSDDVVAVSTDGIYCKRQIMDAAKGLGAWEYEGPLWDAFLIQPGVGTGTSAKGRQLKTRGISKQDAWEKQLFERARVNWDNWGFEAPTTYSCTRFVPVRQALTKSTEAEIRAVIGQWLPQDDRELGFHTPKRVPRRRSKRGWGATRGPELAVPVNSLTDQGLSAQYSKLVSLEKRRERELLEDMRTCAP